MAVSLTYTFKPDDYLIDITGKVEGLGPDGGTLLVGMGPGLRNTESDSVEHARELGVVVKDSKAALTRFGKLKLHQPVAFNGPFEWVAVKSKYFVTAILAPDTGSTGRNGGIGGATALATDTAARITTAAASPPAFRSGPPGAFHFQLYAGPLEYPRLRAIGHDFDDVNPYGWPGFRTIIRPVALGARSLLVWMHERLGLAYGVGLILFGILIRILLWPLNQKAMRSTMAMQAVQPLIKELQEKYKSDPQRLQQEMFKLYKEHNVNPFGGCWPMLLPWPILLAFFFVFQNTIELRGASFLWLPGPLPARSALHHPGHHGAVDVRAEQGRAGRHGAESPDEDDALRHAGDDDVPLPQLRLGAQPVLRGEQHREHPAAVDAVSGAATSQVPMAPRRSGAGAKRKSG